jgi:sulfite exporter TauE/SafE
MSDAGSVAEVITTSLLTPSLSLLAPTVVSAFLLGLSGAAHCVGMCGGIVATLASREGRLPAGQAVIAFTHPHADGVVGVHRSSAGTAVLTPLLYNLGRISSYSIAGALAGAAGSAAWLGSTLLPLQQAAFVIASLMMILIGLHLAGLPVLSHWFERMGAWVWKLVEPAARASLRRPGLRGAFLAGAAWGWVPCGLVYSALTAALVSGSAAAGAAIALAFGLGTLPALSVLGWATGRSLARARTSRLLRVMGVLIVAWGIAGLLHLDPLARLQQFGDACVSGFR